jgi:hypothetical protein
LSEEAYAAQLHEAVGAREAELQAQLRAGGRSLTGRRNVLDQSPFDVPQTHEPRRELSPRVACRSKWARIDALQRLKVLVDAYREAWRAYREGRRDTLFPCGTYWLRLHAAVPCGAPGLTSVHPLRSPPPQWTRTTAPHAKGLECTLRPGISSFSHGGPLLRGPRRVASARIAPCRGVG